MPPLLPHPMCCRCAAVSADKPVPMPCSPRDMLASAAQVLLKVYKALGSDKEYVAFSQRFVVARRGTRPGVSQTPWSTRRFHSSAPINLNAPTLSLVFSLLLWSRCGNTSAVPVPVSAVAAFPQGCASELAAVFRCLSYDARGRLGVLPGLS